MNIQNSNIYSSCSKEQINERREVANMIKVVHYINQFYGGIGGEEKADYKPEVREAVVGPGMALKAALGADAEIVATVICGDSYFNENLEVATSEILEMVKKL
jgi:betaine reductase